MPNWYLTTFPISPHTSRSYITCVFTFFLVCTTKFWFLFVAQECDGVLVFFNKEVLLKQIIKHQKDIDNISVVVLRVYQDVIDINDDALVQEVLEHLIHEQLEDCWCVC